LPSIFTSLKRPFYPLFSCYTSTFKLSDKLCRYLVSGLFWVLRVLLTCIFAHSLITLFIAFWIAMARYIIDGVGASSLVICRKALKTRSVGTKLLELVVLLIAFTAICKHASLGVVRHSFLIISKTRHSKACACLIRPINQ
jgi:hypothetical protein